MTTLTLEPDARLRLQWDGVPTEAQVRAAKAIPGARVVQGGYEWGFWTETAELLAGAFLSNGQAEGVRRIVVGGVGFGPEGWTWVNPIAGARTPWRSPTSPRPHQLAFKAWRRGGGRDGLYHPGALYEGGLGLGKTLSAIEEALELLQHRPRARILVLARNSLIETTWAQQLEQHAPGLCYHLLNGKRRWRGVSLDGAWRRHQPQVWVHSHEDLPAFGKTLAGYVWDMIVIDETSRFRTAGAQRVGRMTGYQARPLTAPFRLGLSGTPVIKSATDAYPILRWLGAPTGNKQQFVTRFMDMNPYTRELTLRDPEGLRGLLDCWRFQVPKSAVLRIPRAWHYEKIQLKPWQRKIYGDVQRDLSEMGISEPSEAQIVQLLRLAQVTAGFEGDRYRPDNAKLEHLVTRIVPELDDDQAIVWTRFREEALGVVDGLRRMGRTAVAFTGAQDDATNAEGFRDFTGGHAQLFVSTLAKGSMGLNLPMAAHMVYVTRDFDTEAIQQSLERNNRLSTTHQVLNVTVLEAENSIDEKVTQVLGDDVHEAAKLTALDVREVLGR